MQNIIEKWTQFKYKFYVLLVMIPLVAFGIGYLGAAIVITAIADEPQGQAIEPVSDQPVWSESQSTIGFARFYERFDSEADAKEYQLQLEDESFVLVDQGHYDVLHSLGFDESLVKSLFHESEEEDEEEVVIVDLTITFKPLSYFTTEASPIPVGEQLLDIYQGVINDLLTAEESDVLEILGSYQLALESLLEMLYENDRNTDIELTKMISKHRDHTKMLLDTNLTVYESYKACVGHFFDLTTLKILF